MISISSSDGDARDDGTDDGGFVDVSHDETFDEAEATLRRSEETFPILESDVAFPPRAFSSAQVSAVTVRDVMRAVAGVRRGEEDAIRFIRAFTGHPDMRWVNEDDPMLLKHALDLAKRHENVLRYVRERVSHSDAEWQRTAYVEVVHMYRHCV